MWHEEPWYHSIVRRVDQKSFEKSNLPKGEKAYKISFFLLSCFRVFEQVAELLCNCHWSQLVTVSQSWMTV